MSAAKNLHNYIIGLPARVTIVDVDVWQDDGGASNVVVWDRTGRSPDDGKWDNELFHVYEYEYDFRPDVKVALEFAGFTIDGPGYDPEWAAYGLPEGAGLILTATR